MKKIFILLLTLVVASSCATLKIAYNSTEDGKRTVVTSDMKLFSVNSYNLDIAMGARVSAEDTVLALLISSDKNSNHGIFGKGNRLMVRFAGGEVMSLENIYNSEFEEKSETIHTADKVNSYGYEYFYSPYDDAIMLAPFEVSTFVPRTYVRRSTISYALYLISKKQIADMCQKEIVKLRVEIEDRDLDMPVPQNASGIVSELYNFLMSQVLTGGTRSEF